MTTYGNVLECIGHTPMIRLAKLDEGTGSQIYAKVEGLNPGGSIKDRAALFMIRDAEERGLLREGSVIIEPTSGNTGIGLSMIGAYLGYKCIIVMPDTMSAERISLMKAFGAEVVLTPGKEGMSGAIKKAEELRGELGGFIPSQFENPSNTMSHVVTTSKEILEQLPDVDYVVAGIGTAGTATGIGMGFKKYSSKAKVIGVTGSAGKTTTKELIKAFLSRIGSVHATEGNYNNHIGLPMTVLNCPREADFLVLEMGTNHPGEIKTLCDIAEPDVGAVTNVGSAHIEFFGSREAIAREKGELLRRAATGFSHKSDELLPGRVETAGAWLADALAPVLPGVHNLANASLAFAVASHFGVTRAQALSSLEDFSLPGSRWRIVEKWGARFIDDTYNANPEAMIAALDAFAATPCKGKRVAVLGDMLELGPESERLHRRVFDHAMSLGIPLVIGVGEMSSKCLCHLVYKSLDRLKCKFRFDVSAGDLVLLKASNSMKLGELIEAMPR